MMQMPCLLQDNVMLEYSMDDADALLEKNLSAAKLSLDNVETDLGFLRDQTTTIEVSILENNTLCMSHYIPFARSLTQVLLWKFPYQSCAIFMPICSDYGFDILYSDWLDALHSQFPRSVLGG